MKVTNYEIIRDIYNLCEKIKNNIVNNGDYSKFSTNDDYSDLILFRLSLIGESVNRLSKEFKEKTKDKIPWRDIVGTRNVITHGYFEVNIEEIWNTVNNDLPILSKFCKEYISQHNKNMEKQND